MKGKRGTSQETWGTALAALSAWLFLTGSAPAGTVEPIRFPSVDGEPIAGLLSLPDGPGPFAAVVTIHGGTGGASEAQLRSHAAPDSNSQTVQEFHARGWAVFAIDYRPDAVFGLERADVVAGIRHLRGDGRIDPDRIAVFGGSHGGHLGLLAAIDMGEEIACLGVGSPWMTDPRLYAEGDIDEPPLSVVPPRQRPVLQRRLAEIRSHLEKLRAAGADVPALLDSYSAKAQADRIRVPTLFLTSRGDVVVPHDFVASTIEAMMAAGRTVEVYTAQASPHGFYWARGPLPETPVLAEERAAALAIITSFFEGCLDP
ncbi:MAG: alpha/beta hydrolase fold domain-containing protein [Alphaproteobacteria bacterium]|nr:alpha/beta hydrolase fold domain-containing protein [Alphaproteobacteria bacterium]